MKQTKFYITDNPYIAKGIRNGLQLKLNVKEGVWDNVGDRDYTVLLEISPQSLYSARRTDKTYISYLERYKDSQVKYHNAFEPTPEGRNRFILFCSQTGLKPEVFLQLNTETADFEAAAGRIDSTGIQAQERELLRWVEQSIDEAYTRRYRQNGYDIHYSCRLFPVFSEIKRHMDINTDINVNKRPASSLRAIFRFEDTDIETHLLNKAGIVLIRDDSAWINELRESLRGCKGKVIKFQTEFSMSRPPRPYRYLDFLQDVMTNGEGISLADARDILYNFYLCNLITFPKTQGNGIPPDMIHKIMTPASLQGLPEYEKSIEGIIYNDVHDYLLKYSPDAGGILLLDHGEGDFARLYDEVANKKEKIVLDMLIKRQLCQYVGPCAEEHCRVEIKAGKKDFSGEFKNMLYLGWKRIYMEGEGIRPNMQFSEGQELELAELEEDTKQGCYLHDISSIIRLLKLYSVGNTEMITETIEMLYRSVYIGRIGERYLTLREKDMLSIVPPDLRNMESYSRLIEGIRTALCNGESVNKVKKGISDMIQENLKLIDSFCRKGTVDEETR